MVGFTHTIKSLYSFIYLGSCLSNESCNIFHLIVFSLSLSSDTHLFFDHFRFHSVTWLFNRLFSYIVIRILIRGWNRLFSLDLNLRGITGCIKVRRSKHVDHIHSPICFRGLYLIEIFLTFPLDLKLQNSCRLSINSKWTLLELFIVSEVLGRARTSFIIYSNSLFSLLKCLFDLLFSFFV